MAKGKRFRGKRKKKKESEEPQNATLIHPFLCKYPEGNSHYFRRMSTKSGELSPETQKWITLPSTALDLQIDSVTPSEISITVNQTFRVVAVPVFVGDLSFEKGWYENQRLIKGTSKNYALNNMKTIHLGTLKYYQGLESDNPMQKDPDEGRVYMGKDTTLEFRDPKSNNWITLPHEGIIFHYDLGGYIFSCSALENDKIKSPFEYETYTIFNAPPQRIALALGIDFGNCLLNKKSEIGRIPEIIVFFGRVEYLDQEKQLDLYRRAAALSSIKKFPQDLSTVYTKLPNYSHQNEFRFYVTLRNYDWDYESNPSLEIPMSPNFQLHCGFTYFV